LSLRLELEEPAGQSRRRWPVCGGVPFAPAALASDVGLRLYDPLGREVVMQTRPLALWPDGSLRWVWLGFQVDLPPFGHVAYELVDRPGAERQPAAPGVAVSRVPDGFAVDTGPLRFLATPGPGRGLLGQVWLAGQPLLDDTRRLGFDLEAGGRRYSTAWGQVTQIEVEETGPVRAVLHVRGDHRSTDGGRLFGYDLRLYAYAGLPWLEVEYTFINDADAPETELARLGVELRLQAPETDPGRPATLYLAAPQSSDVAAGDDDGSALTGVAGWMAAGDDRASLAVAVKGCAQLAPKRFHREGARLCVDLWPAEAGPLRWHQGMARTHRMLWWFHTGRDWEPASRSVCAAYAAAPLAWTPRACSETGALGPLLAPEACPLPELEAALHGQFELWHSTNRALGFLDYGDFPQTAQFWKEAGYMGNNQLDLVHALALQYARTGQRRYYDDLEAAAWHLMDVDVIHHTTHDPLELGGARMQGTGHVQYNCEGLADVSVAPSQIWVEGLLEYYYLSGAPRALEIARGIGECLLRMLARGWAQPPYHVAWHGSRDSGWPLIALSALYEATGEARWLAGARQIVDALLAAQGEDGGWDMWFGWRRCLSALHLGITLTALSRYHALTGEARVRAALLRAADALVARCAFPEGVLIYVDAPGYRWNYYSGVAFEALGYAWALTDDLRYLRAARLAHRRALARDRRRPLNGAGLADLWRGTLRYLYWAERAGLLADLPG